MPISDQLASSHIAAWEEKLKTQISYSYRSLWPQFLFRHERVENAARILIDGNLLSRNGANGLGAIDIAAQNVIQTRDDAHKYARLYFRPKTPTQFSVEGIKKADELRQGEENAHAPVLVMFIFYAKKVITLPGVGFSNGNMQSQVTQFGFDETFFKNIPFQDVYHEGPFGPDTSIKRSRCAEVLAPSPMPLSNGLAGILCRSTAERRTLIHLLNNQSNLWKDKIKVFTKPGIFQSDWAYVYTVNLATNELELVLHPRKDSRHVDVTVSIQNITSKVVIKWSGTINPAERLRLMLNPPLHGEFVVSIWLENHLAYQAQTTIDDLPF